ncbi:MAG TPA: hypothetical protein VJK09_01755 [Candidatus Paceibacterota bacterium]
MALRGKKIIEPRREFIKVPVRFPGEVYFPPRVIKLLSPEKFFVLSPDGTLRVGTQLDIKLQMVSSVSNVPLRGIVTRRDTFKGMLCSLDLDRLRKNLRMRAFGALQRYLALPIQRREDSFGPCLADVFDYS